MNNECWMDGCPNPGTNEVEEVYFDLGEPVMRMYSTEDYRTPSLKAPVFKREMKS